MRSQEEKWRVPESDPAGQQHTSDPRLARDRPERDGTGDGDEESRAGLIYCGQCGALNPTSSYFCAACGATLIDAFHASEGLRVYDRPDTASRLIEIVPAGNELDLVDDPDAPEDFVRVKLSHGRLGYIRLNDVDALSRSVSPVKPPVGAPDINTAARGCVTQVSALAALLLLVVISTLFFLYVAQSDSAESGIIALAFCVVVGPLLALTIGLYVFARSRAERLEDEAAELEEAAQG